MPISELFHETGRFADDLCVINGMFTDIPNHEPSMFMMNSGHVQAIRPSYGSWLLYGLGTENDNLPGFVVLISSGVQPNGGNKSFGSGFLPSVYQGVQCRSKGDPVLYASDPPGMDRDSLGPHLDVAVAGRQPVPVLGQLQQDGVVDDAAFLVGQQDILALSRPAAASCQRNA